VEDAWCPAEASQDDVDDEVMITTRSLRTESGGIKRATIARQNPPYRLSVELRAYRVVKIERTKRLMMNGPPDEAGRTGSIRSRRSCVVSSESDR
jgi:hypothetical protein